MAKTKKTKIERIFALHRLFIKILAYWIGNHMLCARGQVRIDFPTSITLNKLKRDSGGPIRLQSYLRTEWNGIARIEIDVDLLNRW